MLKIKILGYCWKSQMNGAVYDVCGISPCVTCGCYSGVEPKILDIKYERNIRSKQEQR